MKAHTPLGILLFFRFWFLNIFLGTLNILNIPHIWFFSFFSLFIITRRIWIEKKLKIRVEKLYFLFYLRGCWIFIFFYKSKQIDILNSIYYSIHQFAHHDFWFFLIIDGESLTKITWIWIRVCGDQRWKWRWH